MKVCDKCKSPEGVEEVSIQVSTNSKRVLGHGELCAACVGSIDMLSAIALGEVPPLAPGTGANAPETPKRELHPSEK